MQPAREAIDLTQYAAAVNGALAHHRPAFVATSGEGGTPDIGPKGSMFVADAGHLAFLEYTGGGHLANLRRNAKVAVVCFDPEAEPRYVRFYGEAQLLEAGGLRDELRARAFKKPDRAGPRPRRQTTRGSACESASTKW
jgi:Pyridoxamine 5'-phosphate oxidase